jgi:hypothetical protein
MFSTGKNWVAVSLGVNHANEEKSLNAFLALGIAFTQTLALAAPSADGSEVTNSDDSLALKEAFQTLASYVTENGDGSLSPQIPAEVLESLDQFIYSDFAASLALNIALL